MSCCSLVYSWSFSFSLFGVSSSSPPKMLLVCFRSTSGLILFNLLFTTLEQIIEKNEEISGNISSSSRLGAFVPWLDIVEALFSKTSSFLSRCFWILNHIKLVPAVLSFRKENLIVREHFCFLWKDKNDKRPFRNVLFEKLFKQFELHKKEEAVNGHSSERWRKKVLKKVLGV